MRILYPVASAILILPLLKVRLLSFAPTFVKPPPSIFSIGVRAKAQRPAALINHIVFDPELPEQVSGPHHRDVPITSYEICSAFRVSPMEHQEFAPSGLQDRPSARR